MTPRQTQTLFLGIILVSLLVPTVYVDALEPTIWLFPLVLLIGIPVSIKRGWPQHIPTWIIFNLIGIFCAVYGAWVIGTILPVWAILTGFALMLAYDIWAVHNSNHMENLSQTAFAWGYPAAIIIPHTAAFDFEMFVNTVRENGLAATHGDPKTGTALLGIGDIGIPGGLAVAVRIAAPATSGLAGFGGTEPALLVVGGIATGFLVLFTLVPERLAALTVAIPGAVGGLTIAILIGLVPISALFP